MYTASKLCTSLNIFKIYWIYTYSTMLWCYDLRTYNRSLAFTNTTRIVHNSLAGKLCKCVQGLYCHCMSKWSKKNGDNPTSYSTSVDHSDMPSERILQRETVFPKSNTVYLRMEKLCSSNVSDIKKLLDLTSNDYGLNELCYIPSIATSPFLFASNQLNQETILANEQNEISLSPVYFIRWGFVDNPMIKSNPVKISDNVKGLKKIITIIVEKLKDSKDGVLLQQAWLNLS